jgi:hypothetical protein
VPNHWEHQADQVGRLLATRPAPRHDRPGPAQGPLPDEVRAPAEAALGVDLSRVRVHADSAAGEKVRSHGAIAMTVRDNIYVEPRAWRPGHPLGRALLGHELAHTVQQRMGERHRARDAFLSGEGQAEALGELQQARSGMTLTPAPSGSPQRCVQGCSSCNEPETAPAETREEKLRRRKAELQAIIDAPAAAGTGKLAAAYAEIKDVEHDLAVLERGHGTYVGNRAPDDGQSRTPKPKKSDCTEYTIEVLRDTFTALGQGDRWRQVLAAAQRRSGSGGLKGTDLIAELVSSLGWKALYWNADSQLVDNTASGAEDTEHRYTYLLASGQAGAASKKGKYYGIPIEQDKLIIDYRPNPSSRATKRTTTAQNLTGIERLKRVPFGVLAARGGRHMAVVVYGVVYEVHWDAECTTENVIDATPLESWGWLSGVIGAPAADIDNAWK